MTAGGASDSLREIGIRATTVSDQASMTPLRLQVNGASHEVPPETSVRLLLERLGMQGRRVAVAVNRCVIPRSAFETHRLAAGDRVEILEAVGGG